MCQKGATDEDSWLVAHLCACKQSSGGCHLVTHPEPVGLILMLQPLVSFSTRRRKLDSKSAGLSGHSKQDGGGNGSPRSPGCSSSLLMSSITTVRPESVEQTIRCRNWAHPLNLRTSLPISDLGKISTLPGAESGISCGIVRSQAILRCRSRLESNGHFLALFISYM